jgi:ATP-binding cassette subfamily F protein uup
MALIACRSLRMAFGGRPLFQDANLQIERGERIGLLGRNGEGKSTLLEILSGVLRPDSGEMVLESGVRVALLSQQIPADLPATVEAIIRSGHAGSWDARHPVERLCSMLDLDGAAAFDTLSGGQRRRALLGRALAAEPDILLLDEPTNHLDLDGIEWLESFVTRFAGSLLFVTHDRTFLQRVATRIVELDRGKLTSWVCDYSTYVGRKEELLANEEREWALLDKTLAREEEWIRRGIKARRTRNEGRVRALERLRVERAARRERVGRVRLDIQQADRSGTRVIHAEHVDFAYGEKLLIRGFSATILRGDKVGIIGPNGSGKTTLLRVLLGRIPPSAGTVKHGTALEVAYFDQHREELDQNATVEESVGFGSDHVTIAGERRHVLGYLQDFLFTSERARQPVGSLSGGERNRLLLARLFTRPANLLVLDEPTNDLDTETLELLEARLLEFEGTVLTVSHDRAFLDNLCSSTLVFEGGAVVKEYAGGYSDWKRAAAPREPERVLPRRTPKAHPEREPSDGPRKLTWAERREMEALPARIEELEREMAELHAAMADPESWSRDPGVIRRATDRARDVERAIETAFARWAELAEQGS